MRLYGRKFIRNLVDKRGEDKQTMRDAVIWQVESNTCRVKLQGSDAMVVAHFPRNQKEVPLWLRQGNAVRVVHKDGIRGYVEVVGEGRSIPTPVSGDTLPAVGGIGDCIVEGIIVRATDPASLFVKVSAGTYRIDGIIYEMEEVTGGYIVMDDPAFMLMGVLPYVLNGQVYYELGASPGVGKFRYDIIVVGVDRDLDLIEGTPATWNPVMPSVPIDHVLVASILRVGTETSVGNDRIYQVFTSPYPVTLSVPVGLSVSWSVVTDYPQINVAVSIRDQYGDLVSASTGWILRMTKLIGTGEVWSIDSGYDSDEVTQDMVSEHTYVFKYRRDQTASPEILPFLQVKLEESRSSLYGFGKVELLDSEGGPI